MEDELEEEMMQKEYQFEMACSGQQQQPGKSSRKRSVGDVPKKVKFDDQVSVKSIDQVENEVQVEEPPASTSKAEEDEEEDTDSEKEFETGERCTKKRVHYTNDELFYDPNRDEKDQDWINARRKT